MRVRVLGNLELEVDGGRVAPPSGQVGVLLRTLLLRPNAGISADELAGLLWPDSGEVLTWTGDLAVDETAMVTYSVRLDSDAPAGTSIENLVVGDGPGSNCPNGSSDSDCVVTMTLTATDLPFTGADLLWLLIVALGLVVVGVGLVRIVRNPDVDRTI